MLNTNIEKRYGRELDSFMKLLDASLQGRWKDFDYKEGVRSKYVVVDENTMVVSFGEDTATRPEFSPRLIINFKEYDDNIIITDVWSPKLNKDNAYSPDVLKLIGIKIKGKTNKDLIREKINRLKEEKKKLKDDIELWQEYIRNRKNDIQEIEKEISTLANELS